MRLAVKLQRWYWPVLLLGGLGLSTGWVLAPLFRPGLPPGVDTATFLHLSWFAEQAFSGAHSLVGQDPYWYSDFRPFFTYPPLSYLVTGLLAHGLGLAVETSYKVLLFLAYLGICLSVYYLCRRLRFHPWDSLIGAMAAGLGYPLIAAAGLWGWFSTLLAIPPAICALGLLETACQKRQVRYGLGAGIAFAVVLLTHHMTALVLALLLIVWGLHAYLARRMGPGQSWRVAGAFSLGALALSGWWAIPFLRNILAIGFRREVAGIWEVSILSYAQALLNRGLIGGYIYPSYLGIIIVGALCAGTVLAIASFRQYGHLGLIVLFLLFISFGEAIPLFRWYPLSSLDVSRMFVYLVPLAGTMLAFFLAQLHGTVHGARRRRMLFGGVAALVLLVGGFLVQDAMAARRVLEPYQPDPALIRAARWFNDHPAGKVLVVGAWNWDAYLFPAEGRVRLVDGWYDEGAKEWRSVREIRMMMWSGSVDQKRLYTVMGDLGGQYIVIYESVPAENPRVFREALLARGDLFTLVEEWERITIFSLKCEPVLWPPLGVLSSQH